MIKYFVICLVAIATTSLAQSRQDLYCNPNIVWAGMVEFDIIPDAPEDQNWDVYEVSGLSSNEFRQESKALSKNAKTLGEYMVGNIWDWDVYATSTLKNTVAPQSLDLTYYPNGEPETFGDLGEPIPPKEFSALRVRAMLYYDKQKMLFGMKPLAAAIMRPEYDVPEKVLSYYVVGWTPIMPLEDELPKQAAWGMRIYRDLPFADVEGFKIEWKLDESLYKMMESIRQNPDELKLAAADDLDASASLSKGQVAELGMVKREQLDEMGFDIEMVKVAIPKEEFVGVHVGFDLYWDTEKKQLLGKQQTFAPIFDDSDSSLWSEGRVLKRVFVRKVD